MIDLWIERIVSLERPLLLAFDVDGTLAEIVDDPAAARVEPRVVAALGALVALPEIHLALVTGRDGASLSRVIDLPAAYRAVEHGRLILEPFAAPAEEPITPADRERLAAFERHAANNWVVDGGRLEIKARSRALHVRELEAQDPERARRFLLEAAAVAESLGLHARKGRGVVECELEPGDKGQCLRALQRRTAARSVVYAGDDRTDLPAIAYAHAAQGLGFFVDSAERPRDVVCSVVLDGPTEVAALVIGLSKRLSTRS